MDIGKFDGKRVRLEDTNGDKFEAVATFNSEEYNECELGVAEDSLQLGCIVFYKSQIRNVEIIDEYSGPYGKFEELVADDGMDLIEEILESEENEHVLRLLCYLLDKKPVFSEEDKERLIKELDALIKYNSDKMIVEKSIELKKHTNEIGETNDI